MPQAEISFYFFAEWKDNEDRRFLCREDYFDKGNRFLSGFAKIKLCAESYTSVLKVKRRLSLIKFCGDFLTDFRDLFLQQIIIDNVLASWSKSRTPTSTQIICKDAASMQISNKHS